VLGNTDGLKLFRALIEPLTRNTPATADRGLLNV
jgi:hypothetical protein